MSFSFVERSRHIYSRCPPSWRRSQKAEYATKVINRLRELDPPGRFLVERDDGRYEDAPNEKVLEKTCQALRERKWKGSTKEAYVKDSSPGNFSAESPATGRPSKAGQNGGVDEISRPSASKERGSFNRISVGTLLNVYWPLDKTSYPATVLEKEGGRALLRYATDGVKEWIKLSEHDFTILDA